MKSYINFRKQRPLTPVLVVIVYNSQTKQKKKKTNWWRKGGDTRWEVKSTKIRTKMERG